MSAFGWITLGHRLLAASFLRRRAPRKTRAFVSVPGVESLEAVQLLSTMAALDVVKPAAHVAATKVAAKAVTPTALDTMAMNNTTAAAAMTVTPKAVTQTTQLQTATVANTLTNFSLPFVPTISLFNPSLGTLLDVKVTAQASLTSTIISQNLSTTSGTDITGFTNGNFTIAGISGASGTPISGALDGTTETLPAAAFPGGTPNFTGASTVNFAPLTVSGPPNTTTVYTNAADLAFFTASAGRTTITPTLTENATSGANAANGNLITLVRTTGTGLITVTYDYAPACPPITSIARYGIHHQPTQILLTFAGPVSDVSSVENPIYYTINTQAPNGSFTGPGSKTVPVISAVYNATNHTVLLTTAKQLNVHYLDQLTVNLPCDNGKPTVIVFGSKYSLAGFTNHIGQFVPVSGGEAITPNGPRPLPPGNAHT